MKISSRKKSSPVIMQSKKEIGSISFVKGSSLSSELSKIGEEVDKIEEKIGEGFRLIENNNWHKNDVPKADIQFEKHAEHTYKCTCNICGEEVHRKREKLDLRQDTVFFKNFDFETQHQNLPLEKDFVFILKRLMPTKIMTRSLYLSIPETACFIQGECKFIVSTGKERTLKYIKQKDRLVLHEIRKYFEERRRKKEEDFIINREKEESIGFHMQDSREATKLDILTESSPSANLIKKKGLTHGYVKEGESFISKEVALLKFRDDSVTMLTEPEFNNVMLKRKIDPIWRQTLYLQSSMRIKKLLNTASKVYFVYDRERESPLFKRALSEVKLLNREIHRVSEDYISPEDELHFEDELRQKDYTEYCLYLLIKIHHFLEIVHGIRVLKMGADFAKDEAGTIWLLNISRVEHKQLDVVLRDEAPARNSDGLLNYDDSPDGFVQEIEGTYKENERKNSIKLLNNILKQHYENIKRILGVDILEAYYEETINDEVFTKLHPNAPFKLSDIPRSNIVYEEIREFIIHNSRKLLYPNLSAEKEMTPEVLAKYSFSGNVPKSMIGVVVKKSEQANPNKNKNEISLPKLNESKTRSYSPMRNISKSLASINKAHLGIKTAFSGNLKSTWWNLKPAIREVYIQKQKPDTKTLMKRTLFETLSSNRIPSYREYCETKTNENSLIRKNLFSSKECINLDVAQDSLRRNNLLRSFPKSITAAFKKRPVSLFYQKIRKSDIMQTDSL